MTIKRRIFLKMLAGSAVAATSIKAFGLSSLNLQTVNDSFNYPYRGWEDFYRDEWTWDTVARSTHSQNCTGSCSWNVFVKDGIIMREEQAADYPVIDPSYPDVNPRGCQKGACYAAEYVNGDRRIKYPLIRTGERGEGKWRRASWDEALTLIADKMLDTIDNHGPDAITYFTPIPAMSPVSFSGGVRLAHLTGGVVTSFYDWYCDLPPGSPITLGEQTDVAESTDWMNSKYMILWGSNPLQTRIPDAHFVTEAKYKGCKVLGIYPDYTSSAIRTDQWISVNPGTDAALALAICQKLIADGNIDTGYLQEQTDMPFLVRTDTGKYLRESDVVSGGADDQFYFYCTNHNQIELAPGTEGSSTHNIDISGHSPALTGSYNVDLAAGGSVSVTTVFENMKAQLNSDMTPAQAAPITGIATDVIEDIASEIGTTAMASGGQIMIMHGAGTNHWYHNDLNNRSMLLMLSLCGAIGKNGGGFNHYVGQEKIWPVSGLKKLCFPGGGSKQRFQNMTMWTYVHAEANDGMGAPELAAAGYSQPIRGYLFDSVDKGWMPLYPEGCLGTNKSDFVNNGTTTKDPKMLFIWRGNYFNQAKGNAIVESTMYPKLDLIVDLNFHMDTSALYADIVLPAASHYEKYDINTTDLHSFAHPFTPAIPPMFESKSDWQAYQALAAKIEERAIARGMGSFYDAKWGGNRDLSTLSSQFTNNGSIAADKDAADYILANAPETVGMTIDSIDAQPQRMNHDTTWTSYLEPGRPYTAFTKMTELKHPYETLTGRQQYLIDHEWFMEFGEALPTYKAPIEADNYPLRFNTPHGRWSIHSTWRNAKQMLRLQRGGPIVYMHPSDMTPRGLTDNDWVKIYTSHGDVVVRVKSWPSEKAGRVTMYHGWERYVGVKGKKRNWNSVTPIRMKPTQLAAGYGQLHFALNYWGPTGVQRDVRVEVEKYNG